MGFAEECRRLTDEYLILNEDSTVSSIKELCSEAASNGESRIFYAHPYNQEIMDALKYDGLTVINHNLYGNDGLSIYWGNPMSYDLQLEYKNEFIGYGPNYLDAGINKVSLTNIGESDIEEMLTILPLNTEDKVMLSIDGIIYKSIIKLDGLLSKSSVDIYIKIEKLTSEEELNGSFELAVLTDYIEG